MRPVNLLPADLRPRTESQRQGGANLALAVLGGLLAAVLAYVLVANSVTSRQEETERVKREADQAEANAAPLKGFAEFAQIKQTREGSVKQLAQARIDWERTMRELARLLPSGVWVKDLEASATGEADSSAGATPQSTGASAGQPTGPSLKLSGCARGQRNVAAMLTRLRGLHGATDVTLADSTKAQAASDASGSGPSPPASGSSGTAGGTDTCGRNYSFNATVQLTAAASGQSATRSVPASLGGGQ